VITDEQARDPKDQVLRAERDWALAHLRCDVGALERMMAVEYVQISGCGSILSKEEVLSSFLPGDRHWSEAYSDEHDVRVYGDVAVVVGRWHGRGNNKGVLFDYCARYVSVWVKRDDVWRITTDQSTTIS
jgi:ketosteroid isomerase-like protein